MASPESPEKKKLSKAEKKAARKQAKSQHLLLKHDGISTSDTPTKFLLIGNGGLLNGIQQELLAPLFKHYGDVEDIVMLPGKPYSFVCYKEVERAIKAHDNLQGYVLRDGLGPTNIRMYLSYVKQVPKSCLNCENLPTGLILLEDFIDENMERKLLESIVWDDDATSGPLSVQKSLKHRRVKHHGYEFLYSTNNIDKDTPLPDGMPAIFGQVIDDIMGTGHVQCKPDQLTINQYQPGQGIPPHIDTHSAFEDAIIALSLGSQVLMEFSHPDGRHIPVLLPSRSLVIMTGEARYLWSHGITPRKGDIVPSAKSSDAKGGLTLMPRDVRTSLTFRAIRREPCNCDYPSKCDSQQNKSSMRITQDPSASLPKSETEAAVLEQTHVHEVYEKIAEHFSDTRHKPWPRVAEFLTSLTPGSVVLDVGCGNGKYLGVNSSLYMIGCDRSQHLVDICRQRLFQAFTSDALELPVRSASIDACICIAVIHHLSTPARREKAVREIVRILNSGGLALIYVWAVEQERNKKKSNYLKESKAYEKQQPTNSVLNNNGATNSEQVNMMMAKAPQKHDTCQNSPDVERRHKAKDNFEGSIQNDHDDESSNSKLPVHKNRTQFVQPDLLVPWHLKLKKDKCEGSPSKDATEKDSEESVVYHRYYHVFKEGELQELCLSVGNTEIMNSYYDQGNWCVIFRKK